MAQAILQRWQLYSADTEEAGGINLVPGKQTPNLKWLYLQSVRFDSEQMAPVIKNAFNVGVIIDSCDNEKKKQKKTTQR